MNIPHPILIALCVLLSSSCVPYPGDWCWIGEDFSIDSNITAEHIHTTLAHWSTSSVDVLDCEDICEQVVVAQSTSFEAVRADVYSCEMSLDDQYVATDGSFNAPTGDDTVVGTISCSGTPYDGYCR